MTIPFVGETPTGGERTKFLPRSSKDFFKPFLKTHYNTIKQLSVDYLPVNLYSVPQPRSRTKCSRSDSSRPGQIWSRSSYKARARVEPDNRRLRNSPSHQRSQASTDRQATSKMSLPDGAGREESGPSYRRGHKGSSLLRFSANFTNLSHIGVVAPKRGPRGPQERRGLSQSDLHCSKDGKRKGVWQTLHTKPQSE